MVSLAFRLFILVAFAASASVAVGASAFAEVPQQGARQGTLPNGLRYVVARSGASDGLVHAELRVRAGADNEDADQLEVAHLLEHLLLNYHGLTGRRLPTLDILKRSNPGNGANAFTGPDLTNYVFAVDRASVGLALDLLHEIAGRGIIRDDELRIQRDVVAAERRTMGADWGEGYELARAFGPPSIKGKFISDREASLKLLSKEAVQRFYSDWYRPDLMTLYVVGDLDVDQIAAEVESLFGSIPSHRSRRPPPPVYSGFPDFAAVASDHTADLSVRLIFDDREEPADINTIALNAILASGLRIAAEARGRTLDYPLEGLEISSESGFAKNGVDVHFRTAPATYEAAISEVFDAIASLCQSSSSNQIFETARKSFVDAPSAVVRTSAPQGARLLIAEYLRGEAAGRFGTRIAEPKITPAVFASIIYPAFADRCKTLLSAHALSATVYGPKAASKRFYQRGFLFDAASEGRTPVSLAKTSDPVLQPPPPVPGRGIAYRMQGKGDGKFLVVDDENRPVALLDSQSNSSALIVQIVSEKGVAGGPDATWEGSFYAQRLFDLNGLANLDKFERDAYLSKRHMSATLRLDPTASQIEVVSQTGNLENALNVARWMLSEPVIRPEVQAAAARSWRRDGAASLPQFSQLAGQMLKANHVIDLGRVEQDISREEVLKLWQSQFGSHVKRLIVVSGRFDPKEVLRHLPALVQTKSVEEERQVTSPSKLSPGIRYFTGARVGVSEVFMAMTADVDPRIDLSHLAIELSLLWQDRLLDRLKHREGGTYAPGGAISVSGDKLIFTASFDTKEADIDRLLAAVREELVSFRLEQSQRIRSFSCKRAEVPGVEHFVSLLQMRSLPAATVVSAGCVDGFEAKDLGVISAPKEFIFIRKE